MRKYTARVTREGKWWMVQVPEIDGLTQARRLGEAELMARELIAVTKGIALDEVEVDVDLMLDLADGISNVPTRVAAITANREQAAELERRATLEAASLAKTLSANNIPVRDVGAILGVSHQRAHQLVHS